MRNLFTLSDLVYVAYPMVPLRALCALARLHGRWLYLTNRQSAAAVRDNLANVEGSGTAGDVRAMALSFFQYKSLRNLLFILAPKLTDRVMSRLFTVEGMDRLDRSLASGHRGVILLCTHLNSLSIFLLVVMLRRRGYDLRVALASPRDTWSPSWFRSRYNRLTGDRTYHEHIGAFYCQFNIRPIVRALGEGAAIVQTGDGWHSAAFAEVNFLDRRLPFTTGMLRVAQQTGATVVPVFTDGKPPDRLRFEVGEPFTISSDEPVEAHVAAFAKRLEQHVLSNLECWEHWLVPHALATMAGWQQQPIEKRYSF